MDISPASANSLSTTKTVRLTSFNAIVMVFISEIICAKVLL